MTFAERTKERRLKMGLTQAKLGKKANLPQQVIARIESGAARSLKKIHDLAEALDTTPEWLIFGVSQLQNKTTPSNIGSLNEVEGLIPILEWYEIREIIGSRKRMESALKDVSRERLPTFGNIPVGCYAIRIPSEVFRGSIGLPFSADDILLVNPVLRPKPNNIVLCIDERKNIALQKYIIEDGLKYLKGFDAEKSLIQINKSIKIIGVITQKHTVTYLI